MATPRTSSRQSDKTAAVVEAPTLKEALRLVRTRYGEDARVIRSRTLTRRQSGGLGREKVVEVLVEPVVGSRRSRQSSPTAHVQDRVARRPGLGAEIAAEVERIEDLVRQIAVDQAGNTGRRRRIEANAVSESLVAAGADPGVVVRLGERCQAETGADPRDRTAMLNYLTRNLPAGTGGWSGFSGAHVFLGPAGAGRTEMALAAAARLTADGRQVLVLSLMPRHGGEIRRLQAAAAKHGYDAAVIQKPRQFAAATEHLSQYDVVLLDAPAFGGTSNPANDVLRREIVRNPSIHRHLVFPLDRDLRDCRMILDEARAWNCDWLALSRVDQTSLHGKILDLLDRLPLPISLVGDTSWPDGEPRVADSGLLTDLILATARARAVARA